MKGSSEVAHQKVLGLVRSFDGPVEKEVLHWEVDYGEKAGLFTDLGPRPRRGTLFEIIGNLVDRNLVQLSTDGVVALEISVE